MVICESIEYAHYVHNRISFWKVCGKDNTYDVDMLYRELVYLTIIPFSIMFLYSINCSVMIHLMFYK